MTQVGNPEKQGASRRGRIRRRSVPYRLLGHSLVLARPADGAPIVLPPTAAAVWTALEDWVTIDDVEIHLQKVFPQVSDQDRQTVSRQLLEALREEDLIEQS